MKHTDKNAKILKLTVSKKPFEVMVTGEKKVEYRSDSAWIKSRLYSKRTYSNHPGHSGTEWTPRKYDFVKITNGYKKTSPYLIAVFVGFKTLSIDMARTYSNGLVVNIKDYRYGIQLGEIVETGANLT